MAHCREAHGRGQDLVLSELIRYRINESMDLAKSPLVKRQAFVACLTTRSVIGFAYYM